MGMMAGQDKTFEVKVRVFLPFGVLRALAVDSLALRFRARLR